MLDLLEAVGGDLETAIMSQREEGGTPDVHGRGLTKRKVAREMAHLSLPYYSYKGN